MTGLEALENIGNIDLGDNPYKTFEHNKLKNVYSVDFNLAFKSLKAFEIIKEKRVDIEKIIFYGNVEDYNNSNVYKTLTPEEYEIIKEVIE